MKSGVFISLTGVGWEDTETHWHHIDMTGFVHRIIDSMSKRE